MMVATLAKLTKNIKLGTLTTNLNFYNPAIVAALVSMADNLSEGRLMLGIGSGANMSDIEAMCKVHTVIESWIKENPANWFLQHNRFG